MAHHPIRKYLKKNNLSQAEFAARAGVKPQLLNDVLQGRSHFGRRKALAVVSATGGSVTLEALMMWEPRKRRHQQEAQ